MPTKSNLTILQAMADRELFGKVFRKRLIHGDTWKNWRTFLAALFGLGLDAEAAAIYKQFTGRDDVPTQQASEAWVIAGRRSGKSFIAAFTAVFLACLRDYSSYLAPGETATGMIIASDRAQARVIFGYISGFIDSIEILSRMVVNRTKESITLTNRVRIEVHTGSFRAVRGYSVAFCLLDECAFYDTSESANPAEELVTALRPAMATIPNSLLLGISSPYAKRGILFESHKENYGKRAAPALVWKADTHSMNPSVSRLVIQAAYLRDPAAARAEYGGEFREDISAFIAREVVEARVDHGCFERAFVRGYNYSAFTDPSGGSSDSFTLSIAHREGDKAILDCVREVVPPFSPEGVVAEFSQVLKSYGIGTVTGDAYAGEWPRERFLKCGIEYRVSERTRSEIYLSFLPMLMSGAVQLVDNARLVSQLVSLERRTARSGKDSIDHSPGSHDDVCNSACGAMVEALGGTRELGLISYFQGLVSGRYKEPEAPAEWGKVQALQFELKARGLQPPSDSIFKELPMPPCPSCGATCRVFVGGCGLKCNQCGSVFANTTERNPISVVVEGPCCGSPLLVPIPGGQRCQQCGWQSNVNQPTGISRKNVENYAGGRAVMNSGSFRQSLARLMFGGKR